MPLKLIRLASSILTVLRKLLPWVCASPPSLLSRTLIPVPASGFSPTASPSLHSSEVRPVNLTQSALQSGLTSLPSAKTPASTFSGFQHTSTLLARLHPSSDFGSYRLGNGKGSNSEDGSWGVSCPLLMRSTLSHTLHCAGRLQPAASLEIWLDQKPVHHCCPSENRPLPTFCQLPSLHRTTTVFGVSLLWRRQRDGTASFCCPSHRRHGHPPTTSTRPILDACGPFWSRSGLWHGMKNERERGWMTGLVPYLHSVWLRGFMSLSVLGWTERPSPRHAHSMSRRSCQAKSVTPTVKIALCCQYRNRD